MGALLVAWSTAQAATLDEWVKSALLHDGQVRAARQDLAAAQARLDQAQGSLWPQLNLTANANRASQHLNYEGGKLPDRQDRFSTYGYNLQLTQALYRREDMARREAARMVVDQLTSQAQSAELALVVRVVQPWFEACQQALMQQAAELDVSRHRTRVDAMARRLDRGDLAAHEAALAGADLALAQAKLAEAESERKQRLFVLSELAGSALDPEEQRCADMDVSAQVPDLPSWLQASADHSPEVQAARLAVKVAQAQVQQARGAQGPSLDLVASSGVSNQGPTASLNVGSKARTDSVGVQLSVPLFAGGALSAREREAVAQLGKVEADLDTLVSRLRQEVSSNWRSLHVAQAHEGAAAQRVVALQAQRSAVERRLAQGQAVDAEARQAQQELAAGQAEHMRLQGLALLARVKLMAQVGSPWQEGGAATWPMPLATPP